MSGGFSWSAPGNVLTETARKHAKESMEIRRKLRGSPRKAAINGWAKIQTPAWALLRDDQVASIQLAHITWAPANESRTVPLSSLTETWVPPMAISSP